MHFNFLFNMATTNLYDLLILVDATASMRNYLEALNTSLPKIIAISTLTNCFSRIGILAYRDYCDTPLLEWSGWMHSNEPGDESITSSELIAKAQCLSAEGGGDFPEATKTGLAQMHTLMRKEATTLVLFYTDAPPHAIPFSDYSRHSNACDEIEALEQKDSFGGDGSKFIDWVSAAKFLHSSEKRAQIFSFLNPRMDKRYAGHYIYLSTMVRGATFFLKASNPSTIAQVTVDVLLSWMGAEKAGFDQTINIPARIARYKSVTVMRLIKDEEDATAEAYFLYKRYQHHARTIEDNVAEVDVTADLLKHHLPKIKTPVQDFAQRYKSDADFKKVVGEQLAHIIEMDVAAISLNPIFGSLWRAVCNDRENPVRDKLIATFGLKVDRIADVDEKARMKSWLEESYDFTAEVLETIAAVPVEDRFPCVLLDPTLSFKGGAQANGGEDEPDRAITDFRRDELLEIGRSCDYRILRRLGRILTRLTFVGSADELPAHIAATDNETVPKIPLALVEKEYGRQFWRVLLHIVVPGTVLSARPAALLGALAIKMGVQPLYQAADREMMLWRDRWNDLEVPETWNTSCLSLLLDADKAYLQRLQSIGEPGDDLSRASQSLLNQEDRKLFDRLVSYKLAEFNLHTTLTAQVGWTPNKATASVGYVMFCKSCKFPRSITIMASHGICGLCKASDYTSENEKQEYISRRVTKEDTEATAATWVECNLRTCRAQYVVYGVEQLNVKPKCHYCREQPSHPESKRSSNPAPWLECEKCLNRVIWPKGYRYAAATPFQCAACSNGRATIVDIETSAGNVGKENGMDWLLRNQDRAIEEPFNKRSLFHTISKAGTANFCEKVELFPEPPKGAVELTINGKLVRNVPELKSQLKSWIDQRAAETVQCSLCFSTYRKDLLRPSCRRSGCHQRICADCLSSWYGLNSPGHIINTAALACPFCRRAPSAKTLAAYGMGIHAVGNLKTAFEEKGEWIYAWCLDCSQAKRHMERVCAGGAPQPLSDFVCEDCVAGAAAEAERIAAEIAATEDAIRVAELMPRLKMERKKAKVETKQCPGCGTLTQKVGGCDHIRCAVRSCDAHWCWRCGDAFDDEGIYQHMEDVHGAFYGGGGGLTEDEGE